MQQRPIKKQEKILIEYLLELLNGKRFELTHTVCDLDDDGMQSIRLSSNPQARYLNDLIQVKYLDNDNLLVLITLTESNTNELFELKFSKVYSNELISYPVPEKVKHPIVEKSKTLS